MKQVLLAGSGQVEVFDVPVPCRVRDGALVRNACSLISSGTEGAAVTRRKGILGIYEKATASTDRLQQVWNLSQTLGFKQTWETLRNKLSDYAPLGYSCAGQVVEIDGNGSPFQPGDRVACMGVGIANHAEYVSVPRNLAARIPDGVSFEEASFAALGCIAMQGIRRLDLSPGESVGVIGLGLIGQLCVRLLDALGYRAYGIDLDAARVAKAADQCDVMAWTSQSLDSVDRVRDLTAGHGLDGIVLCAATASSAPVNLAFDLCRPRGRVSIVGDVGLELDRAKMYRKEIEVRLSCSYGAGRYDHEYEQQGRDYPVGYVRWTEGRNLESFLDLLGRKRLSLKPLISHSFPVAEVDFAFQRIKERDANTFGVLLDYDLKPADVAVAKGDRVLHLSGNSPATREGQVRLAVIGAGGYVKGMHLPNLKKLDELFDVVGVASRSGASATVAARRFGAKIATSDYRELLDSSDVDAVLIATRHATHAHFALEALRAGKHVFIEKPMTTTVEDGEAIVRLADKSGLVVRVGFNRRFSPYMARMREAIGGGVRMFNVRVNIGASANDWSNATNEGGRFLGEGVHFLDLCNWFFDDEPSSVDAGVAGDVAVTNPNVSMILRYRCGSVAQLAYTSLGDRGLGKEFFEAFGNGRSAVCNDFRSLQVFGTKPSRGRLSRGDKGQLDVLREFALAIRGQNFHTPGADARAGLAATRLALQAYQVAGQRTSQLPCAA